jgi:hypothetical protein
MKVSVSFKISAYCFNSTLSNAKSLIIFKGGQDLGSKTVLSDEDEPHSFP